MAFIQKGRYYFVRGEWIEPSIEFIFDQWNKIDPRTIDVSFFTKQQDDPGAEEMRQRIYHLLQRADSIRPFEIKQEGITMFDLRCSAKDLLFIDEAFHMVTGYKIKPASESDYLLFLAMLATEEEGFWDLITRGHTNKSLVLKDQPEQTVATLTGGNVPITLTSDWHSYRCIGGDNTSPFQMDGCHPGKKVGDYDIYDRGILPTGLWIKRYL